jgi:hypothetical protein
MKRYVASLCVIGATLVSFGAELSGDLLKLQEDLSSRTKIGTVNDSTFRDNDKKFEVLKFTTNQDPRKKDLNFRVRVTVELTDKAENTCWAQINREQGPVDVEYTGEDVWEFHVPHGEMEKPKVTAYAVQYGILKDGVFVPVAEKFSKVDTVEEITSKSANRVEFTKTLHYYRYINSEDETVSSSPN